MEKNLVSIIIPCYNQGKFIDEAIKSVLSSTYQNIEIIVVNDGSNDVYTNDLLKSNNWKNTTIYTISNKGVSNARNFGISKSKGEYLLLLDADDKISIEYIYKAVEILDIKSDVKVVCCDVALFGIKKGRLKLPQPSIEMLICQNTMVVTSLFRRSDFNLCGGFNDNMNLGFEDWDFWLTLLENGGNIFKLDYLGFYYRIQRRSRNGSIDIEQFKKLRRQIYENHLSLFSKYFFDPINSFEYVLIRNSLEYRIGTILLKPLKAILNIVK